MTYAFYGATGTEAVLDIQPATHPFSADSPLSLQSQLRIENLAWWCLHGERREPVAKIDGAA